MAKPVSIGSVHYFICVDKVSQGLFSCLDSLSRQVSRDGESLGSINLVWNSPEKEHHDAKKYVTQWTCEKRVSSPLHQYWEARKGIPYARNKALDVARERGIEWLAFIDDDCIADAHLAQTLVDHAGRPNVVVVAGGWELVPEASPSSWIPDSVFGVKHYQVNGEDATDGSSISTAYTRNVLFNIAAVDLLLGKSFFDPSLANTGGSDATYFFAVSRAGGEILYAPEAKVTETYGEERMKLAWHFRRRIRNTQQKILRSRVTGEKVVSPELFLSTLWSMAWRLPLTGLVLPLAIRSHRIRRWIGSTVLMNSPLVAVFLLAIGAKFHEYAPTKRWSFLK